MSYLVCDKCKGYYELQPGESPEDFNLTCECGGKLEFFDSDKNNNPNLDKNDAVLGNKTRSYNIITGQSINNYVETLDGAGLIKCPSCGSLNRRGSFSCSVCGELLRSVDVEKEIEIENTRRFIGWSTFNWSYSLLSRVSGYKIENYVYTSFIFILILIPLLLINWKSLNILLPLAYLTVGICLAGLSGSKDYGEAINDGLFVIMLFAIPGLFFIVFWIGQITGYLMSSALFLGCTLAILVGELIGTSLKQRK